MKELAEALGKEIIDTINTSDTRGNSPSYGTNYQKQGKELMSRDELAVMNGSKCVLPHSEHLTRQIRRETFPSGWKTPLS